MKGRGRFQRTTRVNKGQPGRCWRKSMKEFGLATRFELKKKGGQKEKDTQPPLKKENQGFTDRPNLN